jgi:hypothetical protein
VELPGVERDGRVGFERVAQRRYRASVIVSYRPLEPRLLDIALGQGGDKARGLCAP